MNNWADRSGEVFIKTKIVPADDKEILEDMILIAINNAVDKVESDKEEKFGKYGKMFNGLM